MLKTHMIIPLSALQGSQEGETKSASRGNGHLNIYTEREGAVLVWEKLRGRGSSTLS